MNQNARTECLETLLNLAEMFGLEGMSRDVGIPKSTLVRSFINKEVRRHGMPPAPPRESRGCRGPGRMASRASASMSLRRQV